MIKTYGKIWKVIKRLYPILTELGHWKRSVIDQEDVNGVILTCQRQPEKFLCPVGGGTP